MFKKIQLKNGMNVLMIESHKSPVVSIQMWVKTGSADEKKGEEGISHFIEHLVFKGTRKFGVGEIASTIEGSGGELNAYTSFDQTVFYVTISSHYYKTGLEAISEMMGFPEFDEQEIDNEREVVIEEIKRGLDNPHRQASRQLFSTVYKKHPYSLPVIGFEENIHNMSREQIIEYYQSRYVPENMTLLVVGDFDKAEMQREIKNHFGEFKNYKLKKAKRQKEPKQEKPRISVQKSEFQECLLYVTWPAPKADHKDVPAIDVMTLAMGQGESSRLSKSLKLEKNLVNYIGASAFTPQDPGFIAVQASTSADRLPGLLDGLMEELYNILTEPLNKKEMQRAIVNMNSEEFYSIETVDGMARKYGNYEHLFEDYRYFKTFVKEVNSLEPKEIHKALKKYLKPELMSLVVMTPGDEEQAKTLLKAFQKKYEKTYERAKRASKRIEGYKKPAKIKWFPSAGEKFLSRQDKIEKVNLPGGGSLFLRPNYDTQVVSVRSAFLGGVRIEPDEKQGLTELLSHCWGNSTDEYSEHDMNLKIESMAASLSAFGGRNTCGLTMTSLVPFAGETFDLYEQILLRPKFEEAILEREKAQMLEYLKMRKDNPAQQCILRFLSEIFKGHPYAKDPHGTAESVRSLQISDLKATLNKVVTSGNFTAVMTGNFDPEEWKEKFKELASQLPSGAPQTAEFPMAQAREPRRFFEESKKEQSHIIFGFPGLTFKSPDRYTLQLIQSVLAGQGGRLFLELRDKASLAYTVSPLRMEGIDAGYFGAYIGCSPEKGAKAIEMMNIEFKKLIDTKVSEDELQRARRYLIGRHDIDLQKTSSVSAAILFDVIYGLPADEPFQFAEGLEKVTPEDVQNLAEKIFSQPELICAVGPQSPWGEGAKVKI